MLIWSEYNTLFHAEPYGHFLYNPMSNCLIELDQAHVELVEQCRSGGSWNDNEGDSAFVELLHEQHMLVHPGENDKLLMREQYRRNCNSYGHRDIAMTICPTFACNFHCDYCFERTQGNTTVMSDQTIDQLVAFIDQRACRRSVRIDWYGGEPLLAFERIERITSELGKRGIGIEEAQLITNGYLLTPAIIDRLNALNIQVVQITLDGPRHIHDTRRTLQNGHGSFDRILDNIDRLMNSSYEGQCMLRVNIDKRNMAAYPELYRMLQERYSGKNVTVYGSRVKAVDMNYQLSMKEWVDFCLRLYWEEGISTKFMFYPKMHSKGLCIAHYRNAFVAGPQGELYKCWEDVGCSDKEIGNVNNSDPLSNEELSMLYMRGTDHYGQKECLACRFLPICANSCPKARLEKLSASSGAHTPDTCTHFKEHLVDMLLVVYDEYLSAETAALLLDKTVNPLKEQGYRVIFPSEPLC
ncbi:SPASM domain-containing protein [Prosthecochloris sp. N3]|uniref:SPASM domain-containing protein n=1 Tax=Prosthecochloris ethylica TaxID=2743976 RepID=A0ABR9XPK9_9CHLB|nr:radical SAM protein [Prosthecochloris ethylica]MBF0586270.1 SPASM domain-containing protein [Prosthecochloris ethylica]MBF0635976.1 SPASM domain-containing protein [Prosthecochloris ethylica]NUK47349.1 SPASM domain-containing protein [Prosthecochloris ethylica]